MISKDEILKEIQRLAKENHGIPLGFKRFEDKAGISEYDWRRYWARFGDAQREAGFEANSLQTAYNDEYIFEKYIELTRELGKFPVRGELIVKRAKNPDFPTHNVFLRLGTKEKLLSKLLKYAEGKNYKDIVELCKTALKDIKIDGADVSDKNEDTFGSVYLVKSGRFYKIGRTNSMGRRHHEITILLPENLELIHEIKTDDPSGIEAYWHRRFESKRKNGEWFDLNSSDVRAFKRWKRIA